MKRFFRALGDEIIPGLEADGDQPLHRAGGRVYRTVYALFRQPGQLTADYIDGRRQPYLKPIQVYLTISVIFFLLGSNYFQYGLGEYEFVPFLAETADNIEGELARLNISADAYRTRFNERLSAQKKAVIAVMIPFFGLGLLPLFRRRRYGEHLIFSIHFFAALLLYMLVVIKLIYYFVAFVGPLVVMAVPALEAPIEGFFRSENVLVSVIYLPAMWYLYVALRRVYGGGASGNAVKAAALTVWHFFLIVMVFRLGLFYTTYYSIKWFN